MVQKYKSPVRIYQYPFEIVMAAYEKRFPTCPMIPVFLSSEIVSDESSEDGSVQVIERRCKLNVEVPYLLKKLIGVDYCMFIQKNSLDKKNRVLRIEAKNESFSTRVVVTESCVYSVHPENSEWTCFEQEAGLEVKSFFGFEKAIEKIAIQQYSQNIKKGKEVIEHYINELTESGITYIPPWRPEAVEVSSAYSDVVESISESTIITEHTVVRTQQNIRQQIHQERNTSSSSLGPGIHHPAAKLDDLSDSAFLSLSAASLVDPMASTTNDTIRNSKEIKPKLNAEYIRRHLGELSPAEESALVQLRDMLSESHKNLEKMPKYTVMLRFLRAHADPEGEGNFSHIERAHDRLCRSLAWRKLHAVDKLLETYKPPAILSHDSSFWPCGWHGNDKQGRPVYILRLGSMDVKGVLRSLGVAAVIRHVLAAEEEGIRRTETATTNSRNAVTTCVCVVDLEGLSMRHLWRPGVKFFLDLLDILTQHYPESLSHLLIIRAPLLFPLIWAVCAPFLDERTRSKFMVYAGHDCAGLTDYINADVLPQSLGGHCRCGAACCAVGNSQQLNLVPKSQYQFSVLELERNGLPLSDGYAVRQLCAHYPHEVALWVSQPGSLITWDFDIVRGDVVFSLFYSGDSHRLTEPRHVHSACTTGTSVAACSGGVTSGTVQYLDPKSIPSAATPSSTHSDSNEFCVELLEKIQQCKDGDSIQGSHVAKRAGCYVLQWKMRPSSATSVGATSPMSNLPPSAPAAGLAVPSNPSMTTSSTSAASSPSSTAPSDSLFASAMNSIEQSIAAATSGRVTLVYFAAVLPLADAKYSKANAIYDSVSSLSEVSGEHVLAATVTVAEEMTACWQSAASLPSPGSTSSNFAAFFGSTACPTKQQANSVSTATTLVSDVTTKLTVTVEDDDVMATEVYT